MRPCKHIFNTDEQLCRLLKKRSKYQGVVKSLGLAGTGGLHKFEFSSRPRSKCARTLLKARLSFTRGDNLCTVGRKMLGWVMAV